MQMALKKWRKFAWWAGIVAVLAVGVLTYERWFPWVVNQWEVVRNRGAETPAGEEEDDHGHSHSGEGVVATSDSVKLTPQAWKNIGLRTGAVTTSDFLRYVPVPAMVVERPGRSQIQIPAPLTGFVTDIFPLERQAVEPGDPLAKLTLTHEDVVSAQTEFLAALQQLDVIERELERLRNIGEGVIPGKRIIDWQYKWDETQTSIRAFRQSLLLHGLSAEQIEQIERTRKLLRELTVVAPPFSFVEEHNSGDHIYHVQSIETTRGQSVQAGELLMVLADHCLLLVEGKAFEDDAETLIRAAETGETIQVVPIVGGGRAKEALSLRVQSVSDRVETESRALKFYLLLPNELTLESGEGSRKFVAWKYRPGQRMEVRIPTGEKYRSKIVLPTTAVAVDGPNAFVFEQNGDYFDRTDVQVLYRDSDVTVLETDPHLLGSVIALNGAYELNQALKNQSGGAVDPHAGHNH